MEGCQVSFIQLNMRKSFAAAVELNASLSEIKSYICLLSEPYAYKDKLSSVPPNCSKICNKSECRAAILASPNVIITKLDSLTNKDCAVALLKNGNEKIVLVSAYMDIKLSVRPCLLYTSPSPRD